MKAIAPFSDRADCTVIAGQNFGGLSALYVGLYWPKRFGCILSQSGLYWWSHRGRHQEGMLLEQLNTGEVSAEGLRIALGVGVHEPIIVQASQALYAQLHPLRESIFWRQVDGGHGALCWCSDLIQGLIDLQQPLFRDRD